MKHTLLTVAMCVLFTSCSSMPTTTQIKSAEIGTAPSDDVVKSAVNGYLNRTLKDPASAQVGYSKVYKTAYRRNAFSSPKFAWGVTCSVNARNSYGGYVGSQSYCFYFLDDKLVAIRVPLEGGRVLHHALVEIGPGGRTAAQAGVNN